MPTSSSGLREERVRSSPRWRDGVFVNTSGARPGLQSSPWPLLGEYVSTDVQRRPPRALPVEDPRAGWLRKVESGLRVTWLGHSTVLLEVDGLRLLTDPVFGDRASPWSFAGPRRFHPAPVPVEALPELDAVLISHDHYDHLCQATVRALARRGVPMVTALGVGAHLEKLGVAPAAIHELDWHEHVDLGGLRLTATPAQHFSGRGLGDRNRTLWASWVIRSERRAIFFSGDTGLTEEFRDTAARHGPFELTMLEVGAWHPAWGQIHLGPRNALTAFDLLGGGTLFPVHWGTFSLALHAWDEPAQTLVELAGGRRVITPKLGLPVEPAHLAGPTPWWREVGQEAAASPAEVAGPA